MDTGAIEEAVAYVLLGVLGGVTAKQRRSRTWRVIDGPLSSSPEKTSVQLTEGPFRGRKIKVDGLPAEGSVLGFDTKGLIMRGIHDGHYIVDSVDTRAHTAKATWRRD